MKNSIVILIIMLCGCANMGFQSDMSAAQIRATNGVTTCAQYESLVYGQASFITMNTDDTRKGATSSANMAVTCGKSTINFTGTAGVPIPLGATTTTTTIVAPSKP